MLKALIRYLFFCIPSTFLRGLEFILFDREEIIATAFSVQDQYNKELEKKKILIEYLEHCFKRESK